MKRVVLVASLALALVVGFDAGVSWQRRHWDAWVKGAAQRIIAESVRLVPCQDPVVYLTMAR